MKAFSISVETVFWRLNLMIAIVVGAFVFGVPYLGLLAGPVFLSVMLGVSFKRPQKVKKEAKVKYPNLEPLSRVAVV